MSPYDLMIKANRHLIKGGELTDAQKASVARQLLAAKSDERTKRRFYNGVRSPGNIDSNGEGHMYPTFFTPSYNDGKKLQTVIPMSPKTHILSANSYELEIMRLLYLFAPNNPAIQEMTAGALARLKTTCFGYKGCHKGECFEAGVIALRFLAAAAPAETNWIDGQISVFNGHFADKRRHSGVLWYYWLCLSEMPFDIAGPEILRHKEPILRQLNLSHAMSGENDKAIRPVLVCITRNTLARLPEYAHIKDIQPHVSEKDGRLRFDMPALKNRLTT